MQFKRQLWDSIGFFAGLTVIILLEGCASWDWEAAAAAYASPQYQAAASNINAINAQNNQNLNATIAEGNRQMIAQNYTNALAQQQFQAQLARDQADYAAQARTNAQLYQINRSLNQIKYGY